jgi:hypothetical protein
VGYAVLAVIAGFCAVWFIRTGVRLWRGHGRSLSSWIRTGGLFDAHALAGYDRGILVLGVTFACFTVLLGGAAALGMPGKSTPAAEIAVYCVAIAGILVSITLFGGIYYFNRPKSLVPPGLRDQPGVTEGRRRDRAGRRAARATRQPQRTGKRKRP